MAFVQRVQLDAQPESQLIRNKDGKFLPNAMGLGEAGIDADSVGSVLCGVVGVVQCSAVLVYLCRVLPASVPLISYHQLLHIIPKYVFFFFLTKQMLNS